MTDDMIERVAQAIAKYHRAIDDNGEGWNGPLLTERGREAFRDEALAAIAAMRDPTLKMRLAGRRVKSSWLVENEEIEIWQNMIDEAFK